VILDDVDAVVRHVLGMFPADTAQFLSVPVFVLAVVIGFVLVVHKLAPPASRLAAILLTWLITVAGAVLLLAEMAAAAGCRKRGVKPPSVVYNLGDVVASWTVGLTAGAQLMTGKLATFLAGAKVPVLVLLSVGWIWIWNYQHCPDGAGGCARPLSAWYQQVSDDGR
jgi:hypothetical protein